MRNSNERVLRSWSSEQILDYIKELKQGCGNKIDSNGDCFYISSRGNLRLCSTCTRYLKQAESELQRREDEL